MCTKHETHFICGKLEITAILHNSAIASSPMTAAILAIFPSIFNIIICHSHFHLVLGLWKIAKLKVTCSLCISVTTPRLA